MQGSLQKAYEQALLQLSFSRARNLTCEREHGKVQIDTRARCGPGAKRTESFILQDR
jgi:hypothetical protein